LCCGRYSVVGRKLGISTTKRGCVLISFQCYGAFDTTKWFRIVTTLNSFSMGAGMPRMEVGVTADEEEANVATAVYVKYNRLLHGVKRTRHSKREKLTTKFLKKYIHYAKSRHAPILTEEVCNLIFTFLYFLNDLPKLVNMIRDLD
jgi:hypothetical protein